VSRSPLGLAVLAHELLRGVCGNVEDIEDMRVEIPRGHFGVEVGQQSAELLRVIGIPAMLYHHAIPCPPYACGPRWASELWRLVVHSGSLRHRGLRGNVRAEKKRPIRPFWNGLRKEEPHARARWGIA
jgi:hypothetical protein